MTQQFKIDLYDGHLIIEHNQKVMLLDTGSPVSLTNLDEFEFMSKIYKGRKDLLGKSVDLVSAQLGKDIDVLLGLDVLTGYIFDIDYANTTLTVMDSPVERDGTKIDVVSSPMGVLMLKMSVNGRAYNFALDTGAKISYINSAATQNDEATEVRDDFSPIFGNYKTPIFPKEVEIGDRRFLCNFGNLPDTAAEMLLSINGIEGVMGYDLFKTFEVVLDLQRNNLLIL